MRELLHPADPVAQRAPRHFREAAARRQAPCSLLAGSPADRTCSDTGHGSPACHASRSCAPVCPRDPGRNGAGRAQVISARPALPSV